MQSICSLSLGSPQLSSVQFPTSIRLHKCTRSPGPRRRKGQRSIAIVLISGSSSMIRVQGDCSKQDFTRKGSGSSPNAGRISFSPPSSQSLIVNHKSQMGDIRAQYCAVLRNFAHLISKDQKMYTLLKKIEKQK